MSLSNPNVVAIQGGGNVKHLGSAAKVLALFDCIRKFGADTLDQGLLLDRLYKRYLRNEEVEPALTALKHVLRRFEAIHSRDVDWAALGVDTDEPTFQSADASLAEVWSEFFRRINDCGESVLYYCRKGEPWAAPLKLSRADFASLDREDKRPMAEYDALEGPPFWLAEPPPPVSSPSYKSGREVPHGTPGSIQPDYVSPDGMSATFVHRMDE